MFSKFDPKRSKAPSWNSTGSTGSSLGGGSFPAGGSMGGGFPSPPPPQPGTMSPRIDRTDDPLALPIGQSAVIARALAGVGALGMAWLMFASGSALDGFFAYLVMVFYVGSGLWTLATFRNEILARQFAIEIIILVFVSASARIAVPQIFAADYEETTRTAELAEPNQFEGYLVRSKALQSEFELFLVRPETSAPGSEDTPPGKASKTGLDAAYKDVQERYKIAVKSPSPQERQRGFTMHESFRYAQDIYELLAPEIRKATATSKGDAVIVIPGPVRATAQEKMKQWLMAVDALEAKGAPGP